jgi:hypothetical protein
MDKVEQRLFPCFYEQHNEIRARLPGLSGAMIKS